MQYYWPLRLGRKETKAPVVAAESEVHNNDDDDYDRFCRMRQNNRNVSADGWKTELEQYLDDLADEVRRELGLIRELLRERQLPLGMSYVFPCMDPRFCARCELLSCTCPENDVPGMPGSFC